MEDIDSCKHSLSLYLQITHTTKYSYKYYLYRSRGSC